MLASLRLYSPCWPLLGFTHHVGLSKAAQLLSDGLVGGVQTVQLMPELSDIHVRGVPALQLSLNGTESRALNTVPLNRLKMNC